MIAASVEKDKTGHVIGATIIAANPAAATFSGHDGPHALIKTPLKDFLGTSLVTGQWDKVFEAASTWEPQEIEICVRRDGNSKWLRVVAHPIPSGILILLTDITTMKCTVLELEHQKVRLSEEIVQRVALEKELWTLANLDALTNLPNRRSFKESAVLKLAQAKMAHTPCALLALDIDHFKRINDNYGHPAGDLVLRAIGDVLRSSINEEHDLCARLGGEEFVVLLTRKTEKQALVFAETVRAAIEALEVRDGEEIIKPTTSIGVVSNTLTSQLEAMLSEADKALYDAKRQGRNRVVAAKRQPESKAA